MRYFSIKAVIDVAIKSLKVKTSSSPQMTSLKVCQWFEILLILVTYTSITRCFHPDKYDIEFQAFWNLVKSPKYLIVKRIVDFHCNQVDAIKWADSRLQRRNVKTGPFSGSLLNDSRQLNHSLHVQNYVSNYHHPAIIISRRLMILINVIPCYSLLIVFLTYFYHTYGKMGILKYCTRNWHVTPNRMHAILNFLKMMSLYFLEDLICNF